MKKQNRDFLKFTSIVIVFGILMTSCGSTTLIRSIPEGAKIYVDGEPVGVTPYEHYDTKIVGSNTQIRLIMDGYEDINTRITRDEEVDVGALIGGILLPPIPLLWVMKYKPQHTFEMVPYQENIEEVTEATEEVISGSGISPTKASKLVTIKELQDRGILTQDEFDAEKKKILAE